MPRELSDPDLTLRDLSELADLIPDNAIEDRSRGTIDWACTLLMQINLIAAFAGIQLPAPRVVDGVWLLWFLEKACIRARLYQRPPWTLEGKRIRWHFEYPDFSIVGSIWSPYDVTSHERRLYLGFSLFGKFTADFFHGFLADWFVSGQPGGSGSNRTDSSGRSWLEIARLRTENRCVVTVPPCAAKDLHQVVRREFAALEHRNFCMEIVPLSIEQMSMLRQDWDALGTPPPNEETLQWAGTVLDNVRGACEALGGTVSAPETQLRLVWNTTDLPPETVIVIGWFLGGSLLEISVKSEPNHHRVFAVLDFDPAMPDVPEKPRLAAECRVIRGKGTSLGAILREVLQ